MNVEEQLRGYRSTLDAATEAATSTHAPVAPVIRLHPARTLLLAAVTVAAAIAVAFAVVGATHKSSTPPVGVTTMPPPSTTSPPPSPSSTTTTGSVPRAATVALPVKVCPTEYGIIPSPDDQRAPKTIAIESPPFSDPALAGYSDLRGYLPVVAPAGWNCKSIEATDGGQGIGVTPPGAAPRDSWGNGNTVTQPPTDGVFAMLEPACQGCVAGEICGIVPTAAADFPDFASMPCPQPAGQTVFPFGGDRYRIEDPPGTLGPDAAHSILRYVPRTAQTDASVIRVTCILPASQQDVCSAIFGAFFALHPPPWTESSLTIRPTALGAVGVGMNLAVAQSSAGLTFDGSGDGFHYPTKVPSGSLHFYVGFLGNGPKVSCVGAELFTTNHGPIQTVTTPEGFVLGGTVQDMLAIYGSRAKYVPAPKSGMTTNAGYVVKEAGGALAFAVYRDKVFEISGGASSITPNSCTG